jgi:hypothetical protein
MRSLVILYLLLILGFVSLGISGCGEESPQWLAETIVPGESDLVTLGPFRLGFEDAAKVLALQWVRDDVLIGGDAATRPEDGPWVQSREREGEELGEELEAIVLERSFSQLLDVWYYSAASTLVRLRPRRMRDVSSSAIECDLPESHRGPEGFSADEVLTAHAEMSEIVDLILASASKGGRVGMAQLDLGEVNASINTIVKYIVSRDMMDHGVVSVVDKYANRKIVKVLGVCIVEDLLENVGKANAPEGNDKLIDQVSVERVFRHMSELVEQYRAAEVRQHAKFEVAKASRLARVRAAGRRADRERAARCEAELMAILARFSGTRHRDRDDLFFVIAAEAERVGCGGYFR